MMSVSPDNVVSIDNQEEESILSPEDIRSSLIAIGVNNAISSYNSEDKELAQRFFNLPLRYIGPTWPNLSDQSKIRVVDVHSESFNNWIKNAE